MVSKQHKLFWGSSYDRGLDTLLFMWPDILAKYPDAELHVAYGWDLFLKARSNNPERMQWKESVDLLMEQKGIVHYGRVGKDKLKEIRSQCGIWAYPTWFPEINCITALEAQNDGLVPVVINDFALKETVGSGIRIDGDIKEIAVQDKYLEELLNLMGDEKRFLEESQKAIKFAKNYKWDNIAIQWLNEMSEPLSTPKVSVVTVTIREGFWNVMAHNLSRQTYKNFEWVIVDDYKKDRKETAKKYAKKYGLDIKYIRGDKALGKYKRKHGLSRANNTGWKSADGELLVYLQDFILIPENGVESIVDLYRHNPNALIAPVDEYFFPIEPNKDNKEDWWDEKTNVIDRFSWRNIRLQFAGIRKTDNPMDFEMNYAGIPKHIIEKLNGWWEFFDDAIGYDNTEIAHRALDAGYYILIDDTNVAVCLDIGGHDGSREAYEKLLAGNYPTIRDEKRDK